MRNFDCEAEYGDAFNATTDVCERSALNREIIPNSHDMTDTKDMECYIPDTWMDT